MLSVVKEDVPSFLSSTSSIAYCGLLHIQSKSTLLLTKQLKFYEFEQKQLLHYIDLRNSSLKQFADQLASYDGPTSSFYSSEDAANTSTSSSVSIEDHPLGLGKYIWMSTNVYILLRCWQQLLVLKRPKLHGASFELTAEFDNVTDYKLVNGPIKYQAYVELHFANGKRKLTNFQLEDITPSVTEPALSTTVSMQHLQKDINSARAELASERSQTQREIMRMCEMQTFGPASLRSMVLDEKQLLSRSGDLWTRICDEKLVLGTLLINNAGSKCLTIAHNVRALLATEATLNYTYRLYELPPTPQGPLPQDYDELAHFWACQQQEPLQRGRRLDWQPMAESQLLPEASGVLLVSLRLIDVLTVERLELLLLYEVHSDIAGSFNRQLHLGTVDLTELLKNIEAQAPTFKPSTLHQDFLAVIMCQTAHCLLELRFEQIENCAIFQELLVRDFGFVTYQNQLSADTEPAESSLNDTLMQELLPRTCEQKVQHIFYNSQRHFLLLYDTTNEHWHFYATNEVSLCLLLRSLSRDLLKLNCNLSELHLKDCDNVAMPVATAAVHLENALRQELLIWNNLLKESKSDESNLVEQTNTDESDNRRLLDDHQMATDLLVARIKSQIL